MERVITEYEDENGTSYVLLDSFDDDDDSELRNARHSAPPGRSSSSASRRGRLSSNTRPRQRRAVMQTMTRAPDSVTIKTEKVLHFVEVFADGVAELIPLPPPPPPTTGQSEVDMRNQNEHRHALHAHRVLTSRIRATGRVLNKVMKLLLE